MRKLVFVYGTLKQDYGNHRVLGDSELIMETHTEDLFVLVNCGFPYMVPEALCSSSEYTPRQVMGEVYEVVSKDILRGLDSLEGVGYGHYEHKEIKVVGIDEPVTTYVPCDGERVLSLRACSVNKEMYQWP